MRGVVPHVVALLDDVVNEAVSEVGVFATESASPRRQSASTHEAVFGGNHPERLSVELDLMRKQANNDNDGRQTTTTTTTTTATV